jgi:hypothetical protein
MSPVIAMAVLLAADQFTGSARKGEMTRPQAAARRMQSSNASTFR